MYQMTYTIDLSTLRSITLDSGALYGDINGNSGYAGNFVNTLYMKSDDLEML